jgi:hypothetical protein
LTSISGILRVLSVGLRCSGGFDAALLNEHPRAPGATTSSNITDHRDALGSEPVKGALRAAGGGMLALLSVGGSAGAGSSAASSCAPPRASAAYTARVDRALRSGTDVWGNELLAVPGGPTYAAARRHLAPLLYARTSGGRPLTESGVYYLPFAQPFGPQGAGSVQLHVADGSQILAERVGGRSLRIGVGRSGRERYGSCLARLAPAELAGGWRPILETRYRDSSGVHYRQESFATRANGESGLTSYVRLTADARGHRAAHVDERALAHESHSGRHSAHHLGRVESGRRPPARRRGL